MSTATSKASSGYALADELDPNIVEFAELFTQWVASNCPSFGDNDPYYMMQWELLRRLHEEKGIYVSRSLRN